MTMLDDDLLTSLFARAAESFEVPASGRTEILRRASGHARDGEGGVGDAAETSSPAHGGRPGGAEDDEATPITSIAEKRVGPRRRLLATAQRHRILSVAAGIVVILFLAGTIGALMRATSGSGPVMTSGLTREPTPVQAPRHGGPATTVPPGRGAASGAKAGPAATLPGGAKYGTTNSATGTPPSPATSPTPNAPTAPSLPSDAVGQPAKIEQTGTLGLTVGRNDLGPTMTRLVALADANSGFVANSQTQSGAGGRASYGTVTLQVPVDNFSAVLKQAQSLGHTANLSTRATDVTSQYVDLNARIQALQDSRQQYLTILARATTVGDILSVQEQIDTIQQQIEQLQGQLNVLTSETSYSTLTVNVNETTPPSRPAPLPESGLVQAWHDSVGGFVAGVEGLVRVGGPVLFALLLLGLALTGGRILWRRYQRHGL